VEVCFDLAQSFQGTLAALFLLEGRAGRRRAWRRGLAGWRRGTQSDSADVEVFLKPIQLEQIGELEGADIAAAVADLLLEVAHNLGEVSQGKAGAVELEPEPLPVKTQAEVLTGELAIGLVEVLEGGRD
jgi:hypothetical protein